MQRLKKEILQLEGGKQKNVVLRRRFNRLLSAGRGKDGLGLWTPPVMSETEKAQLHIKEAIKRDDQSALLESDYLQRLISRIKDDRDAKKEVDLYYDLAIESFAPQSLKYLHDVGGRVDMDMVGSVYTNFKSGDRFRRDRQEWDYTPSIAVFESLFMRMVDNDRFIAFGYPADKGDPLVKRFQDTLQMLLNLGYDIPLHLGYGQQENRVTTTYIDEGTALYSLRKSTENRGDSSDSLLFLCEDIQLCLRAAWSKRFILKFEVTKPLKLLTIHPWRHTILNLFVGNNSNGSCCHWKTLEMVLEVYCREKGYDGWKAKAFMDNKNVKAKENWSKVLSKSTGEKYWGNKKTGETQWEKPVDINHAGWEVALIGSAKNSKIKYVSHFNAFKSFVY